MKKTYLFLMSLVFVLMLTRPAFTADAKAKPEAKTLITNAELLSWTGPRNPYPGKLGVIEEGAYADILLVNGNLLESVD